MTKKITKTAAPAATKTTRVAMLHQMLSRPGGASVAEIAEAFNGWEHHSCRGLISTSRRKHGWNVKTANADDGRGTVYSIAAARPQAKASAKSAKPKAKRSARASS